MFNSSRRVFLKRFPSDQLLQDGLSFKDLRQESFLISYHKSVYSRTNLSEADVFRLKTYRGSSLIRIKLRLINFQGPNCGHFQI